MKAEELKTVNGGEHPLSQKPEHPYLFGEKLTAHQRGRIVGYKEGSKELLKAEQELSEFREENEELTERANKYEEAYLTAEETITSQKKKIQELEETLEAFKAGILRADSLMEVFGEDIELKELAKATKKIDELEETISELRHGHNHSEAMINGMTDVINTQNAKFEALLKGLGEIRSVPHEHVTEQLLALLNEHSKQKNRINELEKCPECNGTGEHEINVDGADCPSLGGCPFCEGTGKVIS